MQISIFDCIQLQNEREISFKVFNLSWLQDNIFILSLPAAWLSTPSVWSRPSIWSRWPSFWLWSPSMWWCRPSLVLSLHNVGFMLKVEKWLEFWFKIFCAAFNICNNTNMWFLMMVMVMNMFVDDFFHRVRYLFNQFFHDNFFDWDVLDDFDWIRLCVKKNRNIYLFHIFSISTLLSIVAFQRTQKFRKMTKNRK